MKKKEKAEPWMLRRKFKDSEEQNAFIADISGGECILSFSCGKDALAAWIELKKYFTRIVPVYYYSVPGLQFIEDGIRYYEEFFDCHIIRLPHPSFYRMMGNHVFQPPERQKVIEEWEPPMVEYEDLAQMVREDFGLADGAYVATGVRMFDSPARWTTIKSHGSVNHAKKTFFPVYDWKKSQVISAIRESGAKLTVDYKLFGRSFDGLDYRFLAPIRDAFPEDYRKLLEWFPLADLSFFREEMRAQQ